MGKNGALSLYWRTPEAYAVRRGDWKLLAYQDGKKTQLFKMATDPNETRDLAGEQPEQVVQLKKLLNQYQSGDQEREESPN